MKRKVLSPFLFDEQEIRYAIANEKFGTAIIHRHLASLVARFSSQAHDQWSVRPCQFLQEVYR